MEKKLPHRIHQHRQNVASNRRDVPEDTNWKEEIQFDLGKRKRTEDYRPNQKEPEPQQEISKV
ncbi:hypothetical protein E2562_037021 [Oryza meyeriana var. granulata]|uniref:Uncharacterized protein n=1 Tax=Oryza meyeriana var. granulata TaxID=110450 RepID=A0A6G1CLB5_9ORYZ|nr:hypothetical protein E2562_037021 [Oryza meyeriana var. granulata]